MDLDAGFRQRASQRSAEEARGAGYENSTSDFRKVDWWRSDRSCGMFIH
jgi:hypothetical protein